MAYDFDQIEEAFDRLSVKVEEKLSAEHKAGRIKGTEYADVFNNLMAEILRLSFQTPVNDMQVQFTERQKEGFDDNIRQKMLEIQMNAWAMMFSSGLLEEKPCIIQDDEVTTLYCYMKNLAGVPEDPQNPCGDCPATTGSDTE